MLKPAFIDLSHHNAVYSLEDAAKSGIVGVIHKLSEGTGFVDDKVEARAFLAQDAGLLWGLYHFIRPGEIEEQAEFFVNEALYHEVCDHQTLWCLDWEDSGVSVNDALQFMRRVEELTEGARCVLYSGHVLKEALNGNANPELTNHRLWLAQYGSDYDLPPGWEEFWGWQYTESGSCDGVESPVDLNAYVGTAEELRGDWSGREFAPTPRPPRPKREVVIEISTPNDVDVRVIVNGGDT